MACGVCEGLWIKRLLEEFNFTTIICITHNSVCHDQTKYVEVDCHFIKEHIDGELLALNMYRQINS